MKHNQKILFTILVLIIILVSCASTPQDTQQEPEYQGFETVDLNVVRDINDNSISRLYDPEFEIVCYWSRSSRHSTPEIIGQCLKVE